MKLVFFIIGLILLFIAAFVDVAWTGDNRGVVGRVGFGWAGLFFWALSQAPFISG